MGHAVSKVKHLIEPPVVKNPIKVIITGAAGEIAYHLVAALSRGDSFGRYQPIDVVLYGRGCILGAFDGLIIELTDCAFPLLHSIKQTCDLKEGFRDADVAILMSAVKKKSNSQQKHTDLLKENVALIRKHAKYLDSFAKDTVKIVVAANPVNTLAYVVNRYTPSIPNTNISSLTRLDHNRAVAQVAKRCNISTNMVKNVIIWGNHSTTMFPDLKYASVQINSIFYPVYEIVQDDEWLYQLFIDTVRHRSDATYEYKEKINIVSVAQAISDHLRDWWHGTKQDEWISMGVISDGSYGIQPGICFSYPVQIDKEKNFHIVQDLLIDDFSQKSLNLTESELLREFEVANEACNELDGEECELEGCLHNSVIELPSEWSVSEIHSSPTIDLNNVDSVLSDPL